MSANKSPVAEAAERHFVAQERLRMLGQMNVPTDYEARKKQAVAYAEAQANEAAAKRALEAAIRGTDDKPATRAP